MHKTTDTTTVRTMAEIDREHQDPEQWDWEHPVEVVVSPNRSWNLSIRLSRDELRVLSEAAAAANLPVTSFIAQAALEKARRATA
jgi:hypothetical protein